MRKQEQDNDCDINSQHCIFGCEEEDGHDMTVFRLKAMSVNIDGQSMSKVLTLALFRGVADF